MSAELREHDIVRYTPATTWCRDGTARAVRRHDGRLVLCETYWASQDDDSVVRPDAFEVLFNLNDYDQVRQWTFDRYAPTDRQELRTNHGHRVELYVRKGAAESREQIIAHARAQLREAEVQVQSAQFWRDGCERVLAELLAGELHVSETRDWPLRGSA